MNTTTTKAKHAARLILAVPNQPTHWQARHAAAVVAPVGQERAIMGLLRGWLNYADTFENDGDGAGIGADFYAGPQWEEIGRAIVPLLSMECGRLDCGTLDSIIRAALVAEGFTGDW